MNFSFLDKFISQFFIFFRNEMDSNFVNENEQLNIIKILFYISRFTRKKQIHSRTRVVSKKWIRIFTVYYIVGVAF